LVSIDRNGLILNLISAFAQPVILRCGVAEIPVELIVWRLFLFPRLIDPDACLPAAERKK